MKTWLLVHLTVTRRRRDTLIRLQTLHHPLHLARSHYHAAFKTRNQAHHQHHRLSSSRTITRDAAVIKTKAAAPLNPHLHLFFFFFFLWSDFWGWVVKHTHAQSDTPPLLKTSSETHSGRLTRERPARPQQQQRARPVDVCAPPDPRWEGAEKFPQRRARITQRDGVFLLLLLSAALSASRVDALIFFYFFLNPYIYIFIFVAFFPSLHKLFSRTWGEISEPEDAPTGRADSLRRVFLLFPRRLYQVRRTGASFIYSFIFVLRACARLAFRQLLGVKLSDQRRPTLRSAYPHHTTPSPRHFIRFLPFSLSLVETDAQGGVSPTNSSHPHLKSQPDAAVENIFAIN